MDFAPNIRVNGIAPGPTIKNKRQSDKHFKKQYLATPLKKQVYEVIAAIIILTREILISGLREFLAKGQIKLPVSNLAKLKTVLQMTSIALLLSGETGNKIINFQDYNAQTIGIILLWLSAFLTLFTGYDYMRKGIDHAMSEDNKD